MVDAGDLLLGGAALGAAILLSQGDGGGRVPQPPTINIPGGGGGGAPIVLPVGGQETGPSSDVLSGLFNQTRELTDLVTQQQSQLSETTGEVASLRERLSRARERASQPTGGAGGGASPIPDLSGLISGGITGPGGGPNVPTVGGGGGGVGGVTGVLRESQRAGRGVGEASGSFIDTLVKSGRTGAQATNLIFRGEADTTGTFAEGPGGGEKRTLRLPGVNAPIFEGPILPERGGNGSGNVAERLPSDIEFLTP